MANKTSEKYKWVDVVVKLTELTRKKQLQWTVDSESEAYLESDRLTAIFKGEKDRKMFRLYQVKEYIDYSYVALVDQYISQIAYPDFAEKKRLLKEGLLPKFRKKTILQVVSKNGEPILTFPEVNALNDLLTEVEYQVSDIDTFLDEVYKENEAIAN